MPRDPRALLYDILQAADKVGRFTTGLSFEQYAAGDLVRAATERQFGIMGEALVRLQRLDASLPSRIREHAKVVAFRNVVIHGYADLDDAVVWSVIVEKLPLLAEDARTLLGQLGDEGQ